jgi:hypothetical protein
MRFFRTSGAAGCESLVRDVPLRDPLIFTSLN